MLLTILLKKISFHRLLSLSSFRVVELSIIVEDVQGVVCEKRKISMRTEQTFDLYKKLGQHLRFPLPRKHVQHCCADMIGVNTCYLTFIDGKVVHSSVKCK